MKIRIEVKVDGKIVSIHEPYNEDKVEDLGYLQKWLNTVRGDIERTLTSNYDFKEE